MYLGEIKKGVGLQYSCLAGLSVLVAEDNLINTEVIRQYLDFLRIESYFVNDGIECLDVLKNHSYDCVLMDIQMPHLDGLQATYQIRTTLQLKDLPIIGLSASLAKSDWDKGLQYGMNDYLAKPFEVDDLAKILMKYLCK